MRFVSEHRTPEMTRFATDVMNAGGSIAVLGLCVLVALALALAVGAWRAAIAGVGAFVVASVLAPVLKDVAGRPRPPDAVALVDPGGYAMPSAHALRAAALSTGVVLALGLGTAVARRLVIGLVVVANILLGVLMVYLGAHWPTDVLAGWVGGAVIGWLVAMAVLRVFPPDRPPERDGRISEARPAA